MSDSIDDTGRKMPEEPIKASILACIESLTVMIPHDELVAVFMVLVKSLSRREQWELATALSEPIEPHDHALGRDCGNAASSAPVLTIRKVNHD